MMKEQLRLGCHLSAAKGYEAMARTAAEIGANTFQFFTRNPRGGNAKAMDEKDLAAYRVRAAENGIGIIVAHAPYTLNGCSDKPEIRDFACRTMADDLARMEMLPGSLYNFHPGSHVGQGIEAGIEQIADMLNQVMTPDMHTTVLLETMAGKGSEVGGSFEELRAVIDRVTLKDRIGVCIDTCHVHDAGYDIVHDLDGVLTAFDRIVGLDRVKTVHINDSMNPCGARKDRHQKIGQGYIGTDAIVRVMTHPALAGRPFCLETPNELDGYAEEIALLRARCEGVAT